MTDDQCLNQIQDSQLEDPEITVMMLYLKDRTLPDDDKQSRQIVLNFESVEGILYHESPAFP